MLPNKPGTGISRKVEDEEDRQKIKNIMKQIKIPEDMGFIVRTAGFNRTKQEIARDYQHLVRLWKEINKKAKSIHETSMIYQETDFGVRSIRDYLTSEIEEILVDDLETFRKMRAYLRAISPRYIRMLKHYKEKTPLFDSYHLEEQIRVIYQERVELKSGGHIVINPTEAMITIDVNSGRGSNKKNIEETAFKTNIEASEEIARQLRLRDLGGLIAIDFIDMMDKKHIAEVEKSFKKALSIDKARIQLSQNFQVWNSRIIKAEETVNNSGNKLHEMSLLQRQRFASVSGICRAGSVSQNRIGSRQRNLFRIKNNLASRNRRLHS